MGPGFISTSPARITKPSRLVPLEGLKLRSCDSSSSRASASGAVGRGFESPLRHNKGVKSSLADARIENVVLGR